MATQIRTTVLFSLLFGLSLALSGPGARAAQGPPEESLKFFRDLAETRSYSLGLPVTPTPVPDGSAILFLRSGPRDPVLKLFELNVASGKVREVLTPESLLAGAQEQLSVEEKARRERMRMSLRGFVSFQLSEDGSQILLPLSGKLYVVRRADGKVSTLPGEGWIDPRFSPDGKFVAAVKGDELYVITIATSEARPLTRGATETLTHGVAEFVAQEEMDRFQGFWWSPDSTTLAYQETDSSEVEPHYIADPFHPDQPPASFRYPRAGTPNARVRLGLIARDGGPTTWIKWDAEKYPYLARIVWKEASAPLTLLVQTRRQREEKLLAVDPRTGSISELWTETDEAWLNLPDGVPRWLPDGGGFLWATERGGGWRLELHDRQGKIVRSLTPAEFGYHALVDVDEKAGTAVVSGGSDSRETHLWRLPLAGGEPVKLTKGNGIHRADFSENHRVYVDRFSLLDGGRGSPVLSDKGKLLAELPSAAENPPFVPKVELIRVGQERTFDAALIRPRESQAGRRYPVILDVYAGPTVKMVQAVAGAYLTDQWMADQGYLVVRLDGRGTPGHGRAWERAVQGNLIDVALEDQVEGLKLLGAKYPEMDLSRVGVVGWSFGGYFTAMATIRRPDIFRCGVAGAPVTDWQEYDTHYTERYLDLPSANAEGYRKSSVLTYADQLRRPLLLIHGVTDDNVYFTHTLKLTDALFRAGRPYDLLLLPGTHMVSDPEQNFHRWTRVIDFFNVHLAAPAPEAARR